jgi:hypothetical protein
MASYLWKKLSESEKQEIADEAKKLMLDFGKSIESLPDVKDVVIERDFFERSDEGNGCEIDRELMFDNAPEKNADFIIAEKGGWVE